MARSKSALKEGMTQMDFSSMKRIRAAFDNDEKAIRAEYGRMKDIINKRVDRLAAAGETRNNFYRIFGRNPLPSAREMSTKEIMLKMAPMARALSGSYASSLREIKSSRQEAKERLAQSARKAGDEEAAEELEDLSDADYEKIKIIMGMLDNVVRKNLTSKETEDAAYAALRKRKKGDSIKDMAKQALNELDLTPKQKREALHSIDFRWTEKGRTKVNWKKIRSLR